MVPSIPSLFSSSINVGLPLLGEILVKGTALLIVVCVVAAALRRTSAGTRHVVWSSGLAAVVALPLLAMVVPWRWEVLPRLTGVLPPAVSSAGAELPAEGAAGASDATTARNVTGRVLEPDVARVRPTRTARSSLGADVSKAVSRTSSGVMAELSEGARETGNTEVDGEEVPSGAEESAAAGVETEGAQGEADEDLVGDRRGPKAETVLWWLLAAWVIGALVLLARVGGGALTIQRITRRARVLRSTDWTTPLWEAADRLDLPRVPRLFMSDGVQLPFTCGLFRPTIVLPASAGDWTDERRRAVLFHELGHVRRFDLLSHLVGRLACALYWFHPLVWLAARRARAESERACDDLVLSTGTRPSTYADHLLQIVSGAAQSSAPVVAIPMAQRKEFEGRMLAILEPGVSRRGPNRRQSALLVTAIAVLALSVGAMAPIGQGTPPNASGEPAGIPDALAEAEDARAAPLDGGQYAVDALADNEMRGSDTEAAALMRREASTFAQAEEASELDLSEQLRGSLPGTGISIPGGSASFLWMAADTDRVRRRYRDWLSSTTGVATGIEIADRISSELDTFAPAIGDMVGPAVGDALGPTVDAVVSASLDAAAGAAAHASSVAVAEASAAVSALSYRRWPHLDPPVHASARQEQERGEQDARAVAALAAALRDPVVEVRSTAAHTLGEIGDSAAVAALSEALRADAIAEVRRMAAWALGEIGEPAAAAVAALSQAVRADEDAEVRRMAAWALGEIEDEAAIEALGAATADPDPSVAKMAVWAMGEIDSPNAAPYLAPALQSPHAEIRRQAVWALAETEAGAAVEPLMAALSDEDIEVRSMAAWGLGELEDTRAVPALAAALDDGSPEVRRKAAWALGELEPSSAPEALSIALDDSDESVRKRAAWALGEIADPRSAQALTAALGDSSAEVRRTAMWALGEIGGPIAQEALLEAIRSEDPEIRRMAARALARTY